MTIPSALIHAAAADDDEPIMRELLRGGAKGFGGDLGILAGLVGGMGTGDALSGERPAGQRSLLGMNVKDDDALAPYVPLTAESKAQIAEFENQRGRNMALGGLGGGALGGLSGYLIANKLIDSVGKKKPKGEYEPLEKAILKNPFAG
jgi:hypothetical protein